uniref:DDE_Tnp_1_7 domain-containing protein n=1 Tax=Glossina pallidipes TaxID=7398 RepID=A0A1A9Z2D9_GLOPL
YSYFSTPPPQRRRVREAKTRECSNQISFSRWLLLGYTVTVWERFYNCTIVFKYVDNIIKETNHYTNEKIRNKQLSHKSTWDKWQDVTKPEFLAFIAVILNMGLIHLPNLQEYWSTDSIRMQSTHKTLRGGDIMFIVKPQMVVDYAANMGGVDLPDQYASMYYFLRKSLKW